ncbi:MAG: hypothetical protein Q6J68_04345 [Thermostichales cyanobacterium SZTDM-1c_bins_54]
MPSFAVRYHQLPLAVYREIAAHLQCLPGVKAELVPNRDPEFDYLASQVAYLLVQQESEETQGRLQQILDSYGLWQRSEQEA